MGRLLGRRMRILLPAVCLFALAGCTQPEPKVVHNVVPEGEGHRLGCRHCYDEMVRVLRGPPKHRRYKSIARHHCDECMTDASFYVGDDGKLMFRCARCTPEGMPCDRCLPPEPATTQPASASRVGL
ncbi:MAG: hypothetical protein GDA67_15880 [Nitrospira sp. CR1.3]|nr:hypothetical protein [Nitrospira sp. CR1.3]